MLTRQAILSLFELGVVLLHFGYSVKLQLFHDDEFARLLMLKHLAFLEVGVAVVRLAGELREHGQLVVQAALEEGVPDETEQSRFVLA